MFTFPLSAVRAIIARGQTDAAANGGFRNPCYGLSPGLYECPGFWIVGDRGVYAMSNGRLSAGERPMITYSDQCNPDTKPDWYTYKHVHFGSDDGIIFIGAEEVLPLADRRLHRTHLRIDLEGDLVFISVTANANA